MLPQGFQCNQCAAKFAQNSPVISGHILPQCVEGPDQVQNAWVISEDPRGSSSKAQGETNNKRFMHGGGPKVSRACWNLHDSICKLV